MDDKISTSFLKFREMIPPKDRFWADPFVIFKDQKHHIFFEEFLNSKNKGHLSVISIDANGNHTTKG